MAHADLQAAVRALLDATWGTAHPDFPVFYPNAEDPRPTDGSTFLAVDYPVTRAGEGSLGDPGNNLWRQEGVFRVLIFVGRGFGTSDLNGWAAEIEATFRGYATGHIRCFGPYTVTDAGASDDPYFVAAVAVEYELDVFG